MTADNTDKYTRGEKLDFPAGMFLLYAVLSVSHAPLFFCEGADQPPERNSDQIKSE